MNELEKDVHAWDRMITNTGRQFPSDEEIARADARRETRAAIPKRFSWATFSNRDLLLARVEPSDRVAEAEAAIGTSPEEIPISIVITGRAGSGKTALACAMLRRASKLLALPGYFVDTFAIALATKRHKLGDGRAPELSDAIRAGVLLLDELGCEQSPDQAVEELIRRRHNESLPTIFTTPHNQDELRRKYGDGIARRLFESAPVIYLNQAASPPPAQPALPGVP